VIEQYMTDLRHSDPTVRYNAAQQLGSSGDVRALSALISALPDSNEKVQYAAFSGLIKLGDSSAAAPMLTTLIDDMDSRVWALMRLNIGMRLRHGLLDLVPRGDNAIISQIETALARETLDTHQRAFFVRALGRAGTADAANSLLALLHHDNHDIRVAAGEALGWLGDARAVEPLLEMLLDSSDQVREIAVEALGRIGHERAVEPIMRILQDEAEWVRRAAAVALGELGDARALDPLAEAMHDEDEMVQDAAFEAIKKLSTDRFTAVI
jgi:HEAT repeat protein